MQISVNEICQLDRSYIMLAKWKRTFSQVSLRVRRLQVIARRSSPLLMTRRSNPSKLHSSTRRANKRRSLMCRGRSLERPGHSCCQTPGRVKLASGTFGITNLADIKVVASERVCSHAVPTYASRRQQGTCRRNVDVIYRLITLF